MVTKGLNSSKTSTLTLLISFMKSAVQVSSVVITLEMKLMIR